MVSKGIAGTARDSDREKQMGSKVRAEERAKNRGTGEAEIKRVPRKGDPLEETVLRLQFGVQAGRGGIHNGFGFGGNDRSRRKLLGTHAGRVLILQDGLGGFGEGNLVGEEAGAGRPPEEPDVGTEGGRAHVFEVELGLGGLNEGLVEGLELLLGNFGEELLFVAESQGSSTGDTGAAGEAQSFVMRKLGPWTDQRHVATEDVPELGQLIEFVATQESSNRSDTDVTTDGDGGVAAAFRAHGAELKEGELASVTAHAALPEEDRTGGAPADEHGSKQHQGRKHNEGEHSNGDIQSAADNGDRPGAGLDRDGEGRGYRAREIVP